MLTEEQKEEQVETNLQDVAALCKHYMQTLLGAAADTEDDGEALVCVTSSPHGVVAESLCAVAADLSQEQLEAFLSNMVEVPRCMMLVPY